MDDIAGGPAIFQVSINLFLALMLFPIETSIRKFLSRKKEKNTNDIVGSALPYSARNFKVNRKLNGNENSRNLTPTSRQELEMNIINHDSQKTLDKYLTELKSNPDDKIANYNIAVIYINMAKSLYDNAKNPAFATNDNIKAKYIRKGDGMLLAGLTYMEKANADMDSKKGMTVLRQMYTRLKMNDKAASISEKIQNLAEKQVSKV